MCSKFITTALMTVSALPLIKAETPSGADKKNVLFIIVDDLRPELNSYGVSGMITPNLDKLAENGVQFNQAFCNIPVSGASRASLMTGLRPGKSRWWDVNAEIDKEAPGAITLPKHFKENGYTTISNSKVIHGKNDAIDSWDKIWKPKGRGSWRNYLGEENLTGEKAKGNAYAYEHLDVSDDEYFDGATAEKTIKDLRNLKEKNKPFFLAVGILKPHLPFNAPKKYWDLYKESDIVLPENYTMDRSSFPNQAFHTWNELRFYKNIPLKGPLEDTTEAKRLIHGYKACVSYADAQIGKIIDELKTLGLDKNTVVVLIGDHGWSLGNHGEWCKHSNFTVANRSVCFVSAPDLQKGKKVNEMVEFVDLYPTRCD
ncbi:MAG: sulfatase, partial [Bacteroidales bacterium]